MDINIKLESKGLSLNSLGIEQEKALQEAIKSLAHNVYDEILLTAKNTLNTSLRTYEKSLEFKEFGNIYLISISEPGIYFENGFSDFDMIPGLTGGSKAKVSKKGYKYNIIPFRHKPTSKAYGGNRKGNYYESLKKTVRNMNKIQPREIRDRSGRVMGHVIAKAKSTESGITAGMIKVQKKYNTTKQSTYLTFRGVSDNPESKSFSGWKHPGYPGLKAFNKVEKLLDSQVNDIIKVIFGV